MKAICYLRVSTLQQKKSETIEIQRKEIDEYAETNKIEIVEYFADDGVSGAIENRPGLAELYEFIDNNNIDTLIIFKLDRLSRDLRIQENILFDLQTKKNIKVISVKEQDLDSKSPERVLMRQILGSFSQYEKSAITLRLSLGRLNKSRKGKYAGGRPAFGYVSNEKELNVDKEQAKVVRKIFYLRNRKKLSFHQIATDLNNKDILTANNKQWYKATIKNILENKVYKGQLKYKDNTTKRRDLILV